MDNTLHYYTIMFLGESKVGKTSLVNHLSGEDFQENCLSTTGTMFSTTEFVSYDKTKSRLGLWDTTVSERDRRVNHCLYKEVNCFILTYDVHNRNTFDTLSQWIEDIKFYSNPTRKIILVGNKIDMKSQRKVSTEEGKSLARKYQIGFIETSVKTKEHISDIIESIKNGVNSTHWNIQGEENMTEVKNEFNIFNFFKK